MTAVLERPPCPVGIRVCEFGYTRGCHAGISLAVGLEQESSHVLGRRHGAGRRVD